MGVPRDYSPDSLLDGSASPVLRPSPSARREQSASTGSGRFQSLAITSSGFRLLESADKLREFIKENKPTPRRLQKWNKQPNRQVAHGFEGAVTGALAKSV